MPGDWIEGNSPGFIGAAAGILVGLLVFGYGVMSFMDVSPPPLPKSVAMVVLGFLEMVLCFYAMRRVRVAWSFALSLNATAAVIFLFGAPKVRDAFAIDMVLSLVPTLVFIAITALLAVAAEEY
ncbi:MAG TPA: hypothetical protein VML75_28060 [Kofleriaceae bacterium]|nr:hypothetical protein [Kofleriaceae bacterium]